MKRFFINWKTSLTGIGVITGTVAKIANNSWQFNMEDILSIIGGIGLLSAKDGNVSGGTKMQDGGTVPIITEKRTEGQ